MKLTCMRGYSASGKSTMAREIAAETGATVVCRDDLRKMMLGSYWTGKAEDEDRVTVAEQAQVEALLQGNVSVVVDATHLHPPFLYRWAGLAQRLDAEFEVVDVETDARTCAINDLCRERHVGHQVIQRQANKWPQHKWPTVTTTKVTIEPVTPRENLPPAMIVDIDGTLAHIPKGGRSPYDYTRVREDEVDPVIRGLVWNWRFAQQDREVILVSGRDHSCHDATQAWLFENKVIFDHLYMRPNKAVDARGNKTADWIVKYNLFNEHIRDHYNVLMVLDDRKRVVDMWRKLGLKCLQVAPGDF